VLITREQAENRKYWIDEISRLSGDFGIDAKKVEQELSQEVQEHGIDSLIGHLRLCGAIPERYGHDSSESRKLTNKIRAVQSVAENGILHLE